MTKNNDLFDGIFDDGDFEQPLHLPSAPAPQDIGQPSSSWADYRALQEKLMSGVDDDGSVQATGSRRDIQKLVKAIMQMPYDASIHDEPEFKSLTHEEVMIIRQIKAASQNGCIKAFKELMDRAYGKPTQYTDATVRDETLADLLDRLDKEEQKAPFKEFQGFNPEAFARGQHSPN